MKFHLLDEVYFHFWSSSYFDLQIQKSPPRIQKYFVEMIAHHNNCYYQSMILICFLIEDYSRLRKKDRRDLDKAYFRGN